MTDSQQPDPQTPPPPAAPPAYAAAPAPVAGTRSTPKFVVGLILTILGGLGTLLGLGNIGIAVTLLADDPGYALGRLVGGLILPIVLLVVGIVLLATSKRK